MEIVMMVVHSQDSGRGGLGAQSTVKITEGWRPILKPWFIDLGGVLAFIVVVVHVL